MHCASCCKQAETALFLALEVRRLSSPVRRREAAAKGLIRLGFDTERPVCGINASAKHTLTLSLLHAMFINVVFVAGRDGSQASAKHKCRSRPRRRRSNDAGLDAGEQASRNN